MHLCRSSGSHAAAAFEGMTAWTSSCTASPLCEEIVSAVEATAFDGVAATTLSCTASHRCAQPSQVMVAAVYDGTAADSQHLKESCPDLGSQKAAVPKFRAVTCGPATAGTTLHMSQRALAISITSHVPGPCVIGAAKSSGSSIMAVPPMAEWASSPMNRLMQ